VKAEGAEKQLNDGNKVHNEQGSPKNESRPKDDPAAGRIEQILRSAVPLPVHIAKDAGTENKSADNSKKDASGAVPEKGSVQTESPKINPAANSSSGRSSDESTKEEIGTAVDQSTFRKGTENTQTGIRFDETMAAVKIEKGTAPVEGKYYLHGSSKNDDMASFVIDQLSKHISHSIQEKSSEVKLILQPESLGEVTLHVKFEGGKVTTHMEVQQPQVKTVIESGIPALRESLESKGLTVGTIEVFSTQYSLNGKSSQHNQSRYPSRSPNRHGDEDEVFEQGKMLGYNTVEYIM
jgi:flagellar hook-length control protein FliK